MTYKITPYIFSPIHIGTGNDIDPFSYIIDKNGDNYAIYRYDFTKLLTLLSDEDFKIVKYLSENPAISNFLKIRKTVGKLLPKYKDAVVSVTDIEHTDFIDEYNDNTSLDKLNSNEAINQLNIAETYRDGGRLTIPGSSVKGAIRTAILQEAGEFGDLKINDDPFNMFSVSDIHFKNDGVNIGYYLNYPGNSISFAIEKTMLSQAAEVIKYSQLGLPFDIQIKDYLKNGRNTALTKIISECKKGKEQLFSVINKHYLWQLKKDYELFKIGAPDSVFVDRLSNGKLFDDCEKNTSAFIKIGKHSGALGVTFKNRRIKIKRAKGEDGPKYVEEPRTVWHFSLKNKKNVKPEYLYPSGWLLLT